MAGKSEKIAVENVNVPGYSTNVDKDKYLAMRKALLKVLPKNSPGITVAEAQEMLIPLLPEDLFPGGAKSGWWLKTTQLDLESKGKVQRELTKPMQIYRVG